MGVIELRLSLIRAEMERKQNEPPKPINTSTQFVRITNQQKYVSQHCDRGGKDITSIAHWRCQASYCECDCHNHSFTGWEM